MKGMGTSAQYGKYKKPKWAPSASTFGPVWSALYLVIVLSFGYVAYLYTTGAIMWCVVLPFALNVVFNLAYMPLQFRMHKMRLATLDALLVLLTLDWALCVISPYAGWVVVVNLPYLAWAFFATVLQFQIFALNRKK